MQDHLEADNVKKVHRELNKISIMLQVSTGTGLGLQLACKQVLIWLWDKKKSNNCGAEQATVSLVLSEQGRPRTL